MAIRTKEEILEAIKGKIGEDTSDETISLLEDISDTLNDYDDKTKSNTDWKTKYEENDKEWRKRYTDRFFNNEDGKGSKDSDETDEIEESEEPETFEDLFKEGE